METRARFFGLHESKLISVAARKEYILHLLILRLTLIVHLKCPCFYYFLRSGHLDSHDLFLMRQNRKHAIFISLTTYLTTYKIPFVYL